MEKNEKKPVEKTTAAPKQTAPKPTALDYAKEINQQEKWVPKNRIYKIKGIGHNTPRLFLQSQDRPGRGNHRLLYKDKETGSQRAIRYIINFDSPFIEDQDKSGWDLAQEHILFEYGQLGVDSDNLSLQKFLDVHPWNEKNKGGGPVVFFEYDPEAEAKVAVDELMIEVEAIKAAVNADLATTEAVLRPILGVAIHEMKTEVLTRELLLLAKKDPKLVLESLQDESLALQNVVYTAIDYRILMLTDGGLTLKWAANKENILAIPFGNNPYKYVAEWFKTDDGIEILNKITQKLKKQ